MIALGLELARAWPSLDIGHLKRSLPQFTLLIAALTHKYGAASATLAARYYKQERAAQGVTSPFTIVPAKLAGLPQIGAGVDWATQPLWSATPDITSAQTLLTGVAETLVLDTGRDTIVENIHRDPKAKGWARVTEPDPCAFCAMLALRGAVYKKDTAGFRSHGHCRCHAVPVFTAYEPTAQIREWQRLYRDSTSGGGAKKVRREWRAAFDQHQAKQSGAARPAEPSARKVNA